MQSDREHEQLEPVQAPETVRRRRIGLPVWVVVLTVLGSLLFIDWLPYVRAMQVRRKLIEHCKPGMSFPEFKAWVSDNYPAVAVETYTDRYSKQTIGLVGLNHVGIPYSLLAIDYGRGKIPVLKRHALDRWMGTVIRPYAIFLPTDTSGTILRVEP